MSRHHSKDGRFIYTGHDGVPLMNGFTIDDIRRVYFRCRQDRGSWCSVAIKSGAPGKTWQLSGGIDAPTLMPSINCRDCWHGFIEGGRFNDTNHHPEEHQ